MKTITILLARSIFWAGTALAELPALVRSEPVNGATNVPTTIGVLRFYFDQNMDPTAWTFCENDRGQFPPALGAGGDPWRDSRSAQLRVGELQPNTTYAVQLNSATKQGFHAANGDEPLAVAIVIFTTAGAGDHLVAADEVKSTQRDAPSAAPKPGRKPPTGDPDLARAALPEPEAAEDKRQPGTDPPLPGPDPQTGQLLAALNVARTDVTVYDCLAQAEADGRPVTVAFITAIQTMVMAGGLGQLTDLSVTLRGWCAEPNQFVIDTPVLEKVCASMELTPAFLRKIVKGNEQAANKIRETYDYMNKVDDQIRQNHWDTMDAIAEMNYDTLRDYGGYVNEKTGRIEQIPSERLVKNSHGDLVSAEEVRRVIPIADTSYLTVLLQNTIYHPVAEVCRDHALHSSTCQTMILRRPVVYPRSGLQRSSRV